MQFRVTLSYLMAAVAIATAYNSCKNIMTFNVGLVGSVPLADNRRPRIIEAIRGSTADVICLQEVWFESDMSKILAGLSQEFPYHYSKIHVARDALRRREDCNNDRFRVKDTACSLEESTKLYQGIGQCDCLQFCDPFQSACIACIFFNCRIVLRDPSINASCISCIIFEATKFHNISDAIIQCTTPGDVDNRLNPTGLLILSKGRLPRVKYTPIFPGNKMIFERGYITAQLQDGKRIACTHLSANISIYFEYDLPFASYPEQSRAEMDILGRALSKKEHILVGDINSGPRVTGQAGPENNLQGDMTENYEFLTRTFGYDASPYFHQDGRCTFCNSNSLVLGAASNVIDIVMAVSESSYFIDSIKRVFDKDLIPVALSDHFGVQARVCEN